MIRSGAEAVGVAILTLFIVMFTLGAVVFYRYGQMICLAAIVWAIVRFTTPAQRTKAVDTVRSKVVQMRGKASP